MNQSPWSEIFNQFGNMGRDRSAGGSGSSGDSGGNVNIPKVQIPDKWKQLGKRAIIILAIAVVVVLLAAYWWFHPPLNIHSEDVWVFGAIFILLPLFLILTSISRSYSEGKGKRAKSESKAKTFKIFSYIPLVIVALGIVGALASASFFPGNAHKYANVLQTVEEDFATDIQEVDYTSIPVIDRDSAQLLGNRTMGSMADYVSQFVISDIYSQINYHNTPVRVSPLNYADFFKWFTNRSGGIPAYVVVNMTTQNTEIIRLENAIHYSESEPFTKNIDRYVQLKYPFYMFDEKAFEIDEEGVPYWICPVQTRTIGLFGGTNITRVIICNASTGECQDLAVDEVPEWVDRAYPSNLLIQQYNWSGAYTNGWINSWIGQNGVKQTTPGTSGELGYNYIAKDDDVWVYTGVTSATSDNSIIGFVLVNQRTAESHFYSVAGATEDSAMESAEGQVQNLRYTATFPLLLNINNQPTYFMALKDDAGLVKKYAMLDIQRYQNVAVGDTVIDCQKSYKSLLATNGVAESGTMGLMEATGQIANIAQAVVDGNSHYYITLIGDTHIYDCALPSLIEVVRYKAGDTITVRYSEGEPLCAVTEIVTAAA